MAHSIDFDLNDTEDDLLITCGVCLEYYNEKERIPKFLQCHHSFCLLCLRKMVTKLNTITCPLCREQTSVKGGVELLKTNPYTLHFGTLARKKQLAINEARPISWCIRCGTSSRDDCSGHHLILNIEAREQKKYSTLSKYVTECKINWAEAVMERRALNSLLDTVTTSLKIVKEKVEAFIEDNSSQAAVMESLIDEIELFGMNPGEAGFNLSRSLENFKHAADESQTLLVETKNRCAEFNCLNNWSFSFTNKTISQLSAVAFQPSIDTNEPFATTATFALSMLLPNLLKEASKPSTSFANNGTAADENHSESQGGRFVEVPMTAQVKKRAENYAVAAANGNTVPKPLGYRRNSCCFLAIEVNGKALGRIVILLETDYAQKMCQAFYAACRPGSKTTYRGTSFFQTSKDDYINGGSNDETGIETLYIPDKSTLKDERGAIRMRRRDLRDKQVLVGTEFSIILSKGPYRQYPITTVFGRVVEGLDICDQISAINPFKNRILVGECGQL